jgi:hypothetical protein
VHGDVRFDERQVEEERPRALAAMNFSASAIISFGA